MLAARNVLHYGHMTFRDVVTNYIREVSEFLGINVEKTQGTTIRAVYDELSKLQNVDEITQRAFGAVPTPPPSITARHAEVDIAQRLQVARASGSPQVYEKLVVDAIKRGKVDFDKLIKKTVDKFYNMSNLVFKDTRINRQMYLIDPHFPFEMKFSGGITVGVAVDCSGSMSKEKIEKALGELLRAKESKKISFIHLVLFTTQVIADTIFHKKDMDKVFDWIEEHYSSGGTDYNDAIDKLKDYQLIFVITDGWAPDPAPELMKVVKNKIAWVLIDNPGGYVHEGIVIDAT